MADVSPFRALRCDSSRVALSDGIVPRYNGIAAADIPGPVFRVEAQA